MNYARQFWFLYEFDNKVREQTGLIGNRLIQSYDLIK